MMKENLSANRDDGDPGLKKAIVVFALVEALVIFAVVLYTIFR